MKTIIITEKPSVAQEYRKVLKVQSTEKNDGYIEGFSPVLGKEVQITWAVGHLIGICEPEKQNDAWGGKRWTKDTLPMLPDIFKYEPLPSTRKQFYVVKSLYTAKDVETIYYAGDSGREGIYIQALIRNQIFGGKNPKCEEKVVWIDSYTEESIIKGIKEAKPYSAYENMINAGYMRAISDWLIGMNFTRSFTITSKGLITVGRVATPTLAILCKRQDEIEAFKPEDYFGLKAESDYGEYKWKADKRSKFFESEKLFNESGFKKQEDAQALLMELIATPELMAESVETQEKKENAPLLFNLADLQAYCSKVFKISPAKTLECAQTLYEAKLITYPRTDSRYLTTAVAKELSAKGKNVPSRYVDDSKVTDHYALIPTGHTGSMGELESKVYEAIRKRFEAIFMPPHIYDTVSVTCLHEKTGERFFRSDKHIKQNGWKDLYPGMEKEEAGPAPAKGEKFPATFDIHAMQTTPPSAYTTGTLIIAMEKAGKFIEDEELREQIKTCGIGTSATRANIIETLEKRGYISVDKKSQKITPTQSGRTIIPIISVFDKALVSPEMTADMEQKLSDIASGSYDFSKYRSEVEEYIRSTVSRILSENTAVMQKAPAEGKSGKAEISGKCPKCGAKVAKGGFGWYCTGKCGMGIGKVFGKDLTDKQVEKLLLGTSITTTTKTGKKIIVYPDVVQNDYNGKTYYQWKTGWVNN